jgi:hypothetical protein
MGKFNIKQIMQNQIDITKISDLELMKISIELSTQLQQVSNNYKMVIDEFNKREQLTKAEETPKEN